MPGKALEIYGTEAKKVGLFALLVSVIQSGTAIGIAATDSLFLSRVGAGGLPAIYMAMPVVMSLYVPVYAWPTRSWGDQGC